MNNDEKLKRASVIALKDYLGLDKSETLLVLSDKNMREIGFALYDAGMKLCDEAYYMEMEPRENHAEEPPEIIADMMQAVDVIIAPTTKSLTHTKAAWNASRLGVRIATMPGVTVDTMIRCLTGDFQKVIEISEKVQKTIIGADEIHVLTKNGTNISFGISGRKVISSTGVMRNISEKGNMPSGEVYLAPLEGTANGKIVFDGSVAGLGKLDNPVEVIIKEGVASEFIGNHQAEKMAGIIRKVGGNALNVGEFGIGTNPYAIISGDILEDEKSLGTVHFAFGNNKSMGGKIDVPFHLDATVLEPTVFVDDKIIIEKGKMLL